MPAGRPSLLAIGGMVTLLFAGAAGANTSTVFGPHVEDGERAWEYRVGFRPDSSDELEAFEHRLHYQQALNDRWRARLIGQQRSIDGGSLDYQFTRLELQWQFSKSEETGWDGALRFELQKGDESPDRLRLAWTGNLDLTDRWQLRANFLTGRQIGPDASSGLMLEGRTQVSYKLDSGWRVGLESFNDMNSTADIGSFDEQEHQVGPILKGRIGQHVAINAGYLFGVSDAADDGNFRFILTYNL